MDSEANRRPFADIIEGPATGLQSGFFSSSAAPTNPYVAGNPVGGSNAFVGREGLLRDVVRRLADPQHRAIVLHGQRRVGKTSILQQLVAALSNVGSFRPVYFDLQDQAKRSLGEVIVDLARRVASALGQSEPNPVGDPAQWFAKHWLPSLLSDLSDSASLVILFDEFDVLADTRSDQAASSFFPYLRQLLTETQGRVRFVFVIGRNVDDLDSIAKSLFKGAPALRVSLLPPDEATAVIRMSERHESGLRWSPEAIEEALSLTNGHPFLLQHLCFQVWERIHGRSTVPGASAVAEDVVASVSITLDEARNALSWLWDGLSPASRVIASALAGAGNRAISQDELEELLHESGVRVVMRELRLAPELLKEWDLIESTEEGYRFRVELLRRWIEKQRPLARIQRELDFIKPLAETLYQLGETYYERQDLDNAAARLRDALASNPNHARAAELLADILIARQQWGEAHELLEQLHENYPASARARLVQVLMELVKATESDDRQLELLGRALEVQPKHAAADALKRQKWQERGERARAAGQLADAIVAFTNAGLDSIVAELKDELRRQDFDREISRLKRLEEAGTYAAAYDHARGLAERFADLWDLGGELERLKELASLSAIDRRVERALAAGDSKTAILGLAKLVTIQATYRNVTARLHTIVTGVDPIALREELEKSKADLQEGRRLSENTFAQHLGELAKATEDYKQLSETRVQERQAAEALLRGAAAELGDSMQRLKAAHAETSDVAKKLRDADRTITNLKGWLTAVVPLLLAIIPFMFLAAANLRDQAKQRTREELEHERKLAVAATNERIADIVNGHIRATDIVLSATALGADGKCSEKIGYTKRFPARGLCHVSFNAKFVNHLAGAVELQGPLCIKYFDPNEHIDQSTDPGYAFPSQGGTPCTFGVRINQETSGKIDKQSVELDTSSFSYSSGWGSVSGRFYKPGRYRIEFWWQNTRVGADEFHVY